MPPSSAVEPQKRKALSTTTTSSSSSQKHGSGGTGSKRMRKKVERLVDELTGGGSNGSGNDDGGARKGTASGFRGIRVYADRAPLPERRANGDLVFEDWPDFHPNLTPEEVLRAGSFGGTYFRPIYSSVTGETYSTADVIAEFPESWFEGLKRKRYMRPSYDAKLNTYGVKCGGDLQMWEGSGWMSDTDPYGWFQWYCRFYLGRRTSDDKRQVSRGLKCFGPTGRWKSVLCNKIARAGAHYDDRSISPVIRQTLQHWGYRLTKQHYIAHCKKKGLECADDA
eukprot:UC1_evm4s2035